MDYQNLAYALTQVAHNFGAVIVVASPLYLLSTRLAKDIRFLLWLVLGGWLIQVGSGLLFGLVSVYYYGQLPDIRGLAIAALLVKVACAVAGIALAIAMLKEKIDPDCTAASGRWSWRGLATLGAVALAAAAFLRWYS